MMDICVDNRVMGQASDNIKLTPGSVIEISRLPGYTLQTKGKDCNDCKSYFVPGFRLTRK